MGPQSPDCGLRIVTNPSESPHRLTDSEALRAGIGNFLMLVRMMMQQLRLMRCIGILYLSGERIIQTSRGARKLG